MFPVQGLGTSQSYEGCFPIWPARVSDASPPFLLILPHFGRQLYREGIQNILLPVIERRRKLDDCWSG